MLNLRTRKVFDPLIIKISWNKMIFFMKTWARVPFGLCHYGLLETSPIVVRLENSLFRFENQFKTVKKIWGFVDVDFQSLIAKKERKGGKRSSIWSTFFVSKQPIIMKFALLNERVCLGSLRYIFYCEFCIFSVWTFSEIFVEFDFCSLKFYF